jgi:hypothetical protein
MNTRLRSAWGWLTPLRCLFRIASCVMRRAKNTIRNTQYDTLCSTIVENVRQISHILCKTKPIFEKVKWM